MRCGVLAACVAFALGGCGKRVNPAWCQQAENQSSSECPATIEDAAVQATSCTSMAACESDPVNKQCLTTGGADVCVECLANDTCAAATPICSPNHICQRCEHDQECGDSNHYCQDGVCQVASNAYYAAPNGTGTRSGATPCAITAPCSLLDGIAQAQAGQRVLRLVAGTGSNSTSFLLTSTLNLTGPLRISGPSDADPSKRISIDGGGGLDPVVKLSGGAIELDYLGITGGKGTALSCSAGSLTARRLYIHDIDVDGANTPLSIAGTCALTLDASVLMKNKHGALDITGAPGTPFAIHNNVIAQNIGGPAVTLHGNGRFEYNTVADNRATDGTSGVSCVQADGVRLDMNILANNALDNPPDGSPKPPIPQQLTCTLEHGFSNDNVNLRFGGGNDPFTQYRLTIATPLSVVNVSEVVCAGMTDIDLALRPAHARCDMGADECADCPFADLRNTGYQEQGDTGHGNH